MKVPPLKAPSRFELNSSAFSQQEMQDPYSNADTPATVPRPAAANASFGNSSRPLPRLLNQTRARLRGTETPDRTQKRVSPVDTPTQDASAADKIYTADQVTPGPVVAPIPKRQNPDGTRSPVASFGEWEVRNRETGRRSLQAATLTEDELQRSKTPSFNVPLQAVTQPQLQDTRQESPNTSLPFETPPNRAVPAPVRNQTQGVASSVPLTLQHDTSLGSNSAQKSYQTHIHESGVIETGSLRSTAISYEELHWWEHELGASLLKDRSPIPMSLSGALQAAMDEAPELKILHADWYIQMQQTIREDAAFDWTTFVDSVWNRDNNPVGSQLDGAAKRLRSRTASASAGLRRKDRAGGQFEISQQLGLRESNSQFILPNDQGTSRLSLRYERPLLRGAGKEYITGPLQISELDKDIAFDRMQSGIQDHLLAVARAYWTLVLSRGNFLQKTASWNRAKQISDAITSQADLRVTAGTIDRVTSEASSRLSLAIQAEHDIQAGQEVLLELIYASRYTQFARSEVITTTLPPHEPSEIDFDSQTESAVQTRPEIHQAIREIKAASIEYQLSQIDMKPRLDLVLSGYTAGLNPNFDVTRSVVRQFNDVEPGAGIGLEYELPYKNRANKAAAEQRRMAVTRLQREFENIVGEVKQDIRTQAINRNKYAATLPQQAESLVVARRLLTNTQTLRDSHADGLQIGDLYLADLLQLQIRLHDAEYQYLHTQVGFAVSDNAYLRSLSSLQTLTDQNSMPYDEGTNSSTAAPDATGTNLDQHPSRTDSGHVGP